MDSAAINTEMQALLAHSHWVQALARRLVNDPNLAEDLAQETMLAALRDGATQHRSAKAWLGTVLRNLVWERVRREDRRGSRELDAARDEATPSTEALMDRMSAHKEVVEVLMGLPENYREVLLRRYFEGESPNEIAHSLGIPHSTVRTRLSRGTAMMREQLDALHGGDGEAWVAVLLPLVHMPLRGPDSGYLAPAPTGLSVPIMIAGGLAVIAITSLSWLAFSNPDEPQLPIGVPSNLLASPTEPLGSPSIDSSTAGRAPSRAASRVEKSSTDAARATQAPATGVLGGVVVDLSGNGQSGVLMRFERYAGKGGEGLAKQGFGDSVSISDANGEFNMSGARTNGWVVAERSDLVTVLAGTPSMSGERDSLVVVTAPVLQFQGKVVDEFGKPLPEVSLAIRAPNDWLSSLDLGLEAAAPVPFESATDEAGAFNFERAPRIDNSVLVAEYDGFEPFRLQLPSFDDLALELVLMRAVQGQATLLGEVVDLEGRPVPQAIVSDGRYRTFTDELGQYQLECGDNLPTRLMAMKGGYQLGVLEPATEEAEGEWLEFNRISLGPEPLEIRGQLVDSEGRGLSGVRIWVAEPTLFWAPEPDGKADTTTYVGRVPLAKRAYPVLVERVRDELISDLNRTSPWSYVHTDDEGQFVVTGLLDRPYELELLDARTLSHMRTEPIEAGEAELVIAWEPEPMRARVEGRVVSTTGEALAGQRVSVLYDAFQIYRGADQIYGEQLTGRSVTTGPEGRFLLRDLPHGALILVQGSDLPPIALERVGDREEDEELELVVNPLARIQVELEDPESATSFVVRDADGELVTLTKLEGPRRIDMRELRFRRGKSGVLYLPRTAATLELWLDDKLVQSVSLRLTSSELNQLRL